MEGIRLPNVSNICDIIDLNIWHQEIFAVSIASKALCSQQISPSVKYGDLLYREDKRHSSAKCLAHSLYNICLEYICTCRHRLSPTGKGHTSWYLLLLSLRLSSRLGFIADASSDSAGNCIEAMCHQHKRHGLPSSLLQWWEDENGRERSCCCGYVKEGLEGPKGAQDQEKGVARLGMYHWLTIAVKLWAFQYTLVTLDNGKGILLHACTAFFCNILLWCGFCSISFFARYSF